MSAAVLPPHPDENEIVRAAEASELPRLRAEVGAAKADEVVTLGNAALRVFGGIAEPMSRGTMLPKKLVPDASYGTAIVVRVGGAVIRWTPLAHPAAPAVYQEAHGRWRGGRSGGA